MIVFSNETMVRELTARHSPKPEVCSPVNELLAASEYRIMPSTNSDPGRQPPERRHL